MRDLKRLEIDNLHFIGGGSIISFHIENPSDLLVIINFFLTGLMYKPNPSSSSISSVETTRDGIRKIRILASHLVPSQFMKQARRL